MSMLHLDYQVPGDDFTRAGEASGDVKHKLKKLGYEPDAIRGSPSPCTRGDQHGHPRRGRGGVVDIDPTGWTSCSPTTARASRTWSRPCRRLVHRPDNVRALGFGAGMGLPNMKKYTDEMEIDSVVGEGTKVRMVVYPGRKE